jgi:hypothetical protein
MILHVVEARFFNSPRLRRFSFLPEPWNPRTLGLQPQITQMGGQMVRTKENADGGETTRTGHPSCPPVRNLVSYWYDSAPWRTWRPWRFSVGLRVIGRR